MEISLRNGRVPEERVIYPIYWNVLKGRSQSLFIFPWSVLGAKPRSIVRYLCMFVEQS